jgi:hypothetical protein
MRVPVLREFPTHLNFNFSNVIFKLRSVIKLGDC